MNDTIAKFPVAEIKESTMITRSTLGALTI